MAGDATEAPSTQRLEQLRAQGIVPRSRVAAFLLLTAISAVSLWSLSDELVAWWGEYRGLISSSAESGSRSLEVARIQDGLAPFIPFFLVPVGLGAAGVLGLGLFQSRFLIRPAACGFDFARVVSGVQLRGGVGRILRMIVDVFLILALVVIIGSLLWPLGLSLLTLDRAAAIRVPELLCRVVAFGFGVIGTAIGVIAVVWNHLEFRRVHRMTRQELLREASEEGQ